MKYAILLLCMLLAPSCTVMPRMDIPDVVAPHMVDENAPLATQRDAAKKLASFWQGESKRLTQAVEQEKIDGWKRLLNFIGVGALLGAAVAAGLVLVFPAGTKLLIAVAASSASVAVACFSFASIFAYLPIIAFGVLAAGICVGLFLLYKSSQATKLVAQFGDQMEQAEYSDQVQAIKHAAKTLQGELGVGRLIAKIRGKNG
jgi:hypothetical protein